MRVLLVQPGIYIYGGAELVIVKLAKYMTKRGIENSLLTTSMLSEVERDLDGTEIIIQKRSKFPFDILGSKELFDLNKGVRRNVKGFDVINVHNYPAEFSVFPYHKPVVWMCNEPFLFLSLDFKSSPTSRLVKKALLSFDKFVVKYYAKYVVVADDFNAKRFEGIYGFRPEIIPYGIDYEFFSRGDGKKVLEKFGLLDNFVVLHVGMVTPFKNQIESLKTIEKLKSRIPNIKLVLSGWEERGYKSVLKRYIQERNLDDYVVFTGHLDRDSIRDLYHACDVLLHPIKSQGGWLAPFEALCAGKPIVVSTEMSASNIIKDEKIGMVTDDFAATTWDIYCNPDRYREIASNGRDWVGKNLSWDRFCERMVALFYKVVEKSR